MNEMNNLVENYLAIWNETGSDTRRALISKTWDDAATYVDPVFESIGHAEIDAMVAGFQRAYPNHTFRPLGEIETHHDRIRFRWELVTENGEIGAAGTDVAVIKGGRLYSVTGFFDLAPVLDAA